MRGAEPGERSTAGRATAAAAVAARVWAGGGRRRAAAAGEIQIQIWIMIRARPAGRRELGEEEVAAGEEPEPDGAGWSPGEDPHVGQEA